MENVLEIVLMLLVASVAWFLKRMDDRLKDGDKKFEHMLELIREGGAHREKIATELQTHVKYHPPARVVEVSATSSE